MTTTTTKQPRTREELRAMLLDALKAAAEGTALAPTGKGTYTTPDGTVITRK